MRYQFGLGVYLCFLCLVPGSPSYYRFFVDTVGCILTLISLYFLHGFFTSRPIQQRNILNSQALLLVYVQLVFTVRMYIVSVMTTFLQGVMITLLGTCPGTMNIVLGGRHYFVCLIVATCLMGVTQFIMLASPATFQRIRHDAGFWISAVTVVFWGLMDLMLNIVKCMVEQGHFVPFKHLNWLSLELGLNRYNYTESGPTIWNSTESLEESAAVKEQCQFYPVPQTFIFLTLVFKMVNIIIVILSDIKKGKKPYESFSLKTIKNKCASKTSQLELQGLQEANQSVTPEANQIALPELMEQETVAQEDSAVTPALRVSTVRPASTEDGVEEEPQVTEQHGSETNIVITVTDGNSRKSAPQLGILGTYPKGRFGSSINDGLKKILYKSGTVTLMVFIVGVAVNLSILS